MSTALGRRWVLLSALVLALAFPSTPAAHEIPARVALLAWVKPQGNTLTLLLRVPFESMRDLEIPMIDSVYLDLDRVAELLPGAAKSWLIDYVAMYEAGELLPQPRLVHARITAPDNRSFVTYDSALAHMSAAPLDTATRLPWQQALMDVQLEYAIASEASRFSIEPAWAHLGVRTISVLRFLPPGRGERAFQYEGNPGLVRLDPRWHQAAFTFVALGFKHILGGLDHVLFVFCLVVPFRRLRPLVVIVTAFTVAHSITLIASALGLAPDALWFPPLVETLIAVSILYMALENIVGARLERRSAIAFGFGLVHGFGFSFILRDSLQFAGTHMATSLLAFNVGVELGQLLVIVLLIPAVTLLFRYVVAERLGTIIVSAFVAHTAWHWMLQRGSELRQYELGAPVFGPAFFASLMRGMVVVLVVLGVVWIWRGRKGSGTAKE